MTERHHPVYPEITDSQWAVLSAMTDQRCEHMMEAMDFVADLSDEAKHFLRTADKEKIQQLNSYMDFFKSSRTVWRFFWIGGGMIIAFVVGAAQIYKTFGEYFTVKLK